MIVDDDVVDDQAGSTPIPPSKGNPTTEHNPLLKIHLV